MTVSPAIVVCTLVDIGLTVRVGESDFTLAYIRIRPDVFTGSTGLDTRRGVVEVAQPHAVVVCTLVDVHFAVVALVAGGTAAFVLVWFDVFTRTIGLDAGGTVLTVSLAIVGSTLVDVHFTGQSRKSGFAIASKRVREDGGVRGRIRTGGVVLARRRVAFVDVGFTALAGETSVRTVACTIVLCLSRPAFDARATTGALSVGLRCDKSAVAVPLTRQCAGVAVWKCNVARVAVRTLWGIKSRFVGAGISVLT